MTLSEKVAYLKGMIEMADLADSKETKIINYIVEILDEMALAVEDNEDCTAELEARVDEIDEDLADLEDEFYDDNPCEGCSAYDDDDDYDDEDYDDDEEFYEMECPACHETICISESMVDVGGIACPNCGTDLAIDYEEEPAEDDSPEA